MEVEGGSSSAARPGGDCSSSGTLSSTYTPGGSPPFSDSGCGGFFHLPSIFSSPELDGEERAKKLRHMKGLVEDFSNGDVGAGLERWFSELDVGWLLHLADGDASGGRIRFIDLQHLSRSWILALREIKESIFTYFVGLGSEEDSSSTSQPVVSEFARFVEATLLKMLAFVDAIAALNTSDHIPCSSEHANATVSVEKLQAHIDVRDALSTASEHIQFCPHSSHCHVESTRITDEMSDLLSSKLGQLDKVIWDAADEIRIGIMAWTEDGVGSADIHKVTRSVISYIKLLDANHLLMSRIVYEAAQLGSYVPEIRNIGPLNSLIWEMFYCLEEKLVRMSQPFPHHSLGFLFLINNSYFIWQQLHPMFDMEFPMAVLNRKIDDYIQTYLQLSWGPVLSCLYCDPSPLCLGRHSPLPQFESEFLKIYNAQKLWKVPDPELRTRLRNAVIKKITSGLKRFLEDYSNGSTSRVTPQKLEEMLQDLFEG
uniref:Exocyst subunit Exo70 family protein n=1 Tax=Arundo donax TaxID=35708 RepID=A0A0A9HQ38_ARUDO